MSVVMKFGGTSVGNTNLIKAIAKSIKERKETEDQIVIVVSAMGKNTDHLMNLAKEIGSNLDNREIDTLLATGEQQTIALLTLALKHQGLDAISLTGFQAGFKTTSSHTKSLIVDVDISRVKKHLCENKIVVVAGFQGMAENGDITTLGRGGSDTSAVALAAKFGFPCEIYTDVSGIYRVDPRLYPKSKQLKTMNYDELMEMAIKGAGVIETRSVELAKKFNVPLYIAKSLSEKGSGTVIMDKTYMLEDKPITGVSITDDVVMVTLKHPRLHRTTIAKIFEMIMKENISIDMISQTIDDTGGLVLSFSICQSDIMTMENLLNREPLFEAFTLSIRENLVKISLVGVGMISHLGVASKVFNLLINQGVNYYTVSTSEISISCTINERDKETAIYALSEGFGL